MTEYGLVGERLGHSFSPEIHRAIDSEDYKYELIEVPKDNIDSFFEAKEFKGLNVTIPYKETVIPHLDAIDDAAKTIGAVNTVVVRDGKLYGYNTDYVGMRDAILRAGIKVKGKKVLICGSGGTSKTAEYTARFLGAKETYRLSRKMTDGCITYDEAYTQHCDAEVIINATPCGMFPNEDDVPIDIAHFPKLSGVFDAIFNPQRTNLILNAKKRGIPASGGLYMLVSQAVESYKIFTDNDVMPGICDTIYEWLTRDKENIVLIGMPSSGKSSVGKKVASEFMREFFDTDEMITAAEGKPIIDIFSENGEEYFRDAESRAVKEAASKRGVVIATGGGAVLKHKNVMALARSGKIYFLDRSPELLIATDDRPLSNNRKTLEALYRDRIEIYRSVCDVVIDSNGTVDEAAWLIIDDFLIEDKCYENTCD